MYLYDALNQGDGSLREPHFTSLLYYLFKISHEKFPQNSFLDKFISNYKSDLALSNQYDFEVERDIKIEEILVHDNLRRDTDILIFLRSQSGLKILNIENKINNSAFQNGQLEDQHKLLKRIYPNSTVYNLIILPYEFPHKIAISDENNVIFWHSEDESLVSFIADYINGLIETQNIQADDFVFLKSILGIFNRFSYFLEQNRLSSESSRGPKNVLRYTMFQYLSKIADGWETLFANNPNNVTVKILLEKFDDLVCREILEDFPDDSEERIARFRRGALEAQPKIMTINDKNRVNFGITDPHVKRLFFYPDSMDGNDIGQWKMRRILPVRLMSEFGQYLVYWKDNNTGEVRAANYVNINK